MALLGPRAARLAALLASLVLVGCVGSVANQAQVYSPVTGTIEIDVSLPSGVTFTKVQFQVNDTLISEDDAPSGTSSAQLDTTTLPPDTLAKIAAIGVKADGTTQVLRQNFILVGEQPSAASGTANTDASASPSAAASGTSHLRIGD